MSHVDADRNLLFGVLALQLELIDSRQFADACAGWAVQKEPSLAELLVERGWITADDRAQVDGLLQRKLKRHGGDAHATLGAVADAAARDVIRRIDEPEIRNSISSLPPAAGYVLTETLMPTNPEQRSRYTLTRLHAQGGLGKVWLAHDNDLNREVALKEIQPHQADHAEAWRRFIKEAQVTGQLEHPNIVPVYELARRPQDDQPFYTMRFVRGRTLRKAIAEHHTKRAEAGSDVVGRLKLLQAFVSVCQAIGYAHSRGVIHRDLKPDNVVLGGFGEVIVLDWGLARTITQGDDDRESSTAVALTDAANAEATQPGRQLGSPAYMAPEQALGRLDLIDARTDVYGLGTILFEILTGRPPHDGHDTAHVLSSIIDGETPRARSIGPSAPPALDAICARAMAKARSDRYEKPSDLADDVQCWLADEPISVLREGVPARVARWARRHRAWVQAATAALAVVTLVALGAAILVDGARREAVDRRKDAETQTKIAEHERQEADSQRKIAERRRVEADEQRKVAEERRREALRLTIGTVLERGLSLCEQGDPRRGVLWLARGLELAVDAGDHDLEHTLRANLAAWGTRFHHLQGIFSHPDEVLGVAFSPDGRLALTGCMDGLARVWDVATGQPLGEPLRHPAGVFSVAFRPDGRVFATGTYDMVLLWDVASRRSLGPAIAHNGKLNVHLVFTADGKDVKSDGTVYSADGQIAAACVSETDARVWQVSPYQEIGKVVHTHDGTGYRALVAVALSPDRGVLLTGAGDGLVKRWRIPDCQPLEDPITPGDEVEALAFRPDGLAFLTGSGDAARLWDVRSGRALGDRLTHGGRTRSVAFHPSGLVALSGSQDGTARLWDLRPSDALKDYGETKAVLAPRSTVTALAFAPDGVAYVTGERVDDDRGTARVWESATGRAIEAPLPHPDIVRFAGFSGDGRFVLTASDDRGTLNADRSLTLGGTVRLWDAATGRPAGAPIASGRVNELALRSDGKAVLIGGGRQAQLWDTTTGQPIGPALEHDGAVDFVAFLSGNRILLTRSDIRTPDGKVERRDEWNARLWEAATGRPIGSAVLQDGPVSVISISPDGRTVFTARKDGSARLWEAATGRPVGEPLRHEGPVRAVAFSPDGSTCATACDDGNVRLWDARSGRPIGEPLEHEGPVVAVAFQPPNGRLVVTGGMDKTARLWDASTRRMVGEPIPQRGPVRALAFSPDGRQIAVGCEEHSVRVWDTATHLRIGPNVDAFELGTLRSIGFSPDGRYLWAWDELDDANLWDWSGSLSGTPAQISAWSRVATGLELSPYGLIRDLDPAQWRAWRVKLDEAGGAPAAFAATPERERVWHRGEVQKGFSNGEWYAVAWHLDRLIADDPRDAQLYRDRGVARLGLKRWEESIADLTESIRLGAAVWETHADRGAVLAELGRWPEAAADFTRAVELKADRVEVWVSLARARLAIGDVEGYRRTCAELLDRYGQLNDERTYDPDHANQVAWTCVLAPDAVADRDRVVALARRAIERTEAEKRAGFVQTLGGALYRAGRFAEAIDALSPNVTGGSPGGHPNDWLILALAHHQLGHANQARRWLDRALHAHAVDPGAMMTNLLEREAAKLILDDGFPSDPFQR